MNTFVGTKVNMEAGLDIKVTAQKKLVADPSPKIGTVDVLFNTGRNLFNTKCMRFDIGINLKVSPNVVTEE